MKITIISSLVLLSIFFILQSFTIMSINKTEIQKYSVIQKFKDFEVRFYPSSTIATTRLYAKTYKELANPGFRKLAGYIFGGNNSQTSISMTSPVHMDITDSLSTMSFVMPSAYNLSNLPEPNDRDVVLETSKAEHVAVIQFGGFANEKNMKHYSEKLFKHLDDQGITSYGNYRYLGYNPPFQILGRRNEIIVSVNWEEDKANKIQNLN